MSVKLDYMATPSDHITFRHNVNQAETFTNFGVAVGNYRTVSALLWLSWPTRKRLPRSS